MATFTSKPVAKIQAQLSGSTSTVTVDGITAADSLTAENATDSINKVLDVVGKSVIKAGMKRIITQEVVSNE